RNRVGESNVAVTTHIVLDDVALRTGFGHVQVARECRRPVTASHEHHVYGIFQHDTTCQVHEGAIAGQRQIQGGGASTIGFTTKCLLHQIGFVGQSVGERTKTYAGGQLAELTQRRRVMAVDKYQPVAVVVALKLADDVRGVYSRRI